MSQPDIRAANPRSSERGFSLIETMVSLTILLIVSAGMMTAMLQFSNTQSTVFNRSGMHNAVRSATELLQQEVGQAGRVTLPAAVTLTSAVTTAGVQAVGVSSISNMFVWEYLVIGAGATEETVQVTAINTGANQITADFIELHAATVTRVTARGGFASGIVPTTVTNGSDGTHLKLYGDINGDGNMVYVEYVCDTAGHNLYRNVIQNAVAVTAPAKPAPTADQILLDNIWANPGGTPCFTYQQKVVGVDTFVINVAISLTTQTQFQDRITRQFQQETKALLNVAPRNVFDAWLLASMAVTNRIQPMPASIVSLLPNP